MSGRRLFLTTRGVLALGLVPLCALAGALLGAEELVLVAIALLALVSYGIVQSAHRAGAARGNWRVTLDLPSSDAEVGSQLAMVVVVAAAAGGGGAPLWLDGPQHGWERVGRAAVGGGGPWWSRWSRLPNPSLCLQVAQLESGAVVKLPTLAPTSRRGVFALRGLRLWCFDGFGLVAQLVALGPRATVTVHPAPVRAELSEALLRGDPDTGDRPFIESAAPRRRDSFGDFSGIRPYIPGDRLRLLYWPALACTGELFVRDFDDAGPQCVYLVADVRPLLGDSGRERVLATAAGVGLEALAQGAIVELSTTSGERIAVGPGPFGEIALLRAIAAVETVPPLAPVGWRRRRRSAAPLSQGYRAPLAAGGGMPLVVTTVVGADAAPGIFGFAHLVLVP